MVDGQQTALGGRVAALAIGTETKPLHAVVVVASAFVEIGVGAIVAIGRGARHHRIAQCKQHAGGVSRRHAHAIGQALGHGRKAQQFLGRNHRIVTAATGAHTKTSQHGRADGTHAPRSRPRRDSRAGGGQRQT